MAIQRFRKRLVLILALGFVSCSSEGRDLEAYKEKGLAADFGKKLYENNCIACHGDQGDLGAGGASDLMKSRISKQEVAEVIEKGRNGMPAHDHIYGLKEELDSLVNYVMSLR